MEATAEQKQQLDNPEIQTIISEYTTMLQPVSGRLLVRPSGTENLIRITMWGDDESTITHLANELKDKLQGSLK